MTAIILEAALRGLALAGVVGLALTVLRVRNVPARKAAWTLVLLASLAMPLLMRAVPSRIGWVVPMRFAPGTAPAAAAPQPTVVPQAAASIPAAAVSASTDRAPSAAEALPVDLAPGSISAAAPALSAQPAPLRGFHLPPAAKLVVWIYLAVAGVLLLRLAIGLFAAVRLWISAERVSPLIAPDPNVRASSRIASPVTIGSGIVLPADYTHWDMRKLRMVMAHERSHVRQFDFYLQLLAGLYAALFWFSPVGWWLRRTLSALGEAISDRAGLSAAASPSGYASLVLEFAAMPHKLLPGVAMACSTNLSRRVDSMLNENLFRTLFSEGRRRAMASLLVVPAALFAVTALVRVPSAAAQPAPQNTQPSQAQTPATGQSNPPENQVTTTNPAADAAPAAQPPDQAAPAPPPNPPAPAAGVAGGTPGPAPTAPTMPPAPPAPPAAPAAPASSGPYATSIGSGAGTGYGVSTGSGQSNSVTATDTNTANGSEATAVMQNGSTVSVHGHHSYFFSDGQTVVGNGFRFSSNGDSWAIVNGPGSSYSFSGDWGDNIQAEIDKARKMANGPFLWFRHEGKSYVVTDPAVIARIQQMNEPILALGRQQTELGMQQEILGRRQEELGRTGSESITIRMPDLSKEIADLSAQIAQMKVDQYQVDAKALADLSARLRASEGQMLTPEKLAEIQRNIAAVQQQLTPERIAEMQAQLGEMQARLGALQGEAGARQGDFGERMGELGEQQGRLGEQQGRLGEEQGRLSEEMDRSVRQIIDQALKNGTAKPLQ
jgi:beta-lactamase regulating signal transducer with metallopeptidase domain